MAKPNQNTAQDKVEDLLPGNVTQKDLDKWKEKHGGVHIITIHIDAKDKAVGYYKKPNRDVIANVVNMASAGQIFEAREFLCNNTWLGGDTRHQTDDDVAIPAQIELYKAVNFLKAEAAKY